MARRRHYGIQHRPLVGAPRKVQSVSSFIIMCSSRFLLSFEKCIMPMEKMCRWDLFQYKGKLEEEMEIELAFEIAMNTWASWIDSNVNATRTSIFFRSISPEHKGKHWCYNKTQPIMDESYESTFPKSVTEIVKSTIRKMRTPVKFLNITKLSGYRKDAHPTVYATKEGKLLIRKKQRRPESFADCSHWCLPGLPDTWNRLLYASMVLDTSRMSS